jgi:hypothetical protein
MRKRTPDQRPFGPGVCIPVTDNPGIRFGLYGECNAPGERFQREELSRPTTSRRLQITKHTGGVYACLDWTFQAGEGSDWSVHSTCKR